MKTTKTTRGTKPTALEARVANLEVVVLAMARALHADLSERVNDAEESFRTFDETMMEAERLLPEIVVARDDEQGPLLNA